MRTSGIRPRGHAPPSVCRWSARRRYTDLLPSLGGYLTDKETLHFGRFERFVQQLARTETAYFEMKAGGGAQARSTDPAPPINHKRRYYLQKLGLHPKDEDGRRALVQAYLEGLCWCLAYYHRGCPSWNWYYPDFYGPLASDLTDLEGYHVELMPARHVKKSIYCSGRNVCVPSSGSSLGRMDSRTVANRQTSPS